MTEELPHIRCITCNKPIGSAWNKYQEMLTEGKTVKEALDKLKITRICCRTRLMNPFKTTIYSSRQTDPNDPNKLFESTYEKITTASSDESPTSGALSSMKNTTGVTIVPEEERGIELPPLPSIPLPGTIKSKDTVKIKREYYAW